MSTPNPPSLQDHARRPLRTVLAGVSLGEESDAVVRSALAVARAASARLFLVHAVSATELGAFVGEAGLLLLPDERDPGERLRRQVDQLGITPEELAGAEAVAGQPHRVLLETAERIAADLIVVGATGAGALAAELLGSTADRVLRKSSCPVLVVRGELPSPIRRVLAPVDLSSLSGDSLRRGLEVVGQIADGPVAVRVPYFLSFLEIVARRQQGTQESCDAAAERLAGTTAEQLRRFAAENQPAGPFEVETRVLEGEARFEILADLDRHPADLILIGTHGHSGLDRFVLGSVASTVARKAPCSVLMVPPSTAASAPQ